MEENNRVDVKVSLSFNLSLPKFDAEFLLNNGDEEGLSIDKSALILSRLRSQIPYKEYHIEVADTGSKCFSSY